MRDYPWKQYREKGGGAIDTSSAEHTIELELPDETALHEVPFDLRMGALRSICRFAGENYPSAAVQ